MARYRYRRRNSSRRLWIFGTIVTIAGIWVYGQFVSPVLEGDDEDITGPVARVDTSSPEPAGATTTPFPRLTSRRPDNPGVGADQGVPERGESTRQETQKLANPETTKQAESLLAAGLAAADKDDCIAARNYLNQARNMGLDQQQMLECRAALSRLGAKTIFSPAIIKDDPLVLQHVIRPGESLSKIARKYSITDDFLAQINNITDKNRISAGRNLKVVQGPFHLRIDKKTFQMDVLLQDTFVRNFTVGLGANNGTPSGEWVVGTKLTNPTYYPPRGGKIIPANDPANPLGERWIELIGESGNAVGQQRYGIHGTIDPQSIGKNASMGCVRMHNADVAEVYNLLVTKKSHVTIIE